MFKEQRRQAKKSDKPAQPKYPRSKPEHNPDGLLEAELKAKWQAERGYSMKCKKRHLKDLPAAVRAEIVRMYLEEHVLMRDIAAYYKISFALVNKLVKSATQEKEKVKEHM